MPSLSHILSYVQIVVSLLLIGAILLQQRGGGLGGAFGGGVGGSFYQTRRGVEKLVFRATIVLSSLFLLSTFLNFII